MSELLVASRINVTRKQLGEEADLKPRKVGAILKSLRFKTKTMGSLGRGIELTKEHRERIHDLLKVYGLTNGATAECSLCKERFGANVQQKSQPQEQKVNV